ncbi:MAG: hypothetical protein ACI9ES_001335, partial [Oceanospirillaceae bacterium]
VLREVFLVFGMVRVKVSSVLIIVKQMLYMDRTICDLIDVNCLVILL